jgi:vanillate O-demethylase ferredoxin subunit
MIPADRHWLTLDVATRKDEGGNIASFSLVSSVGTALPPFEAGAHIDVLTASGQIRQYSLCGSPYDRDSYRIAVALHPQSRGGSRSIHEQLAAGSRVLVGPPRNNFLLTGGGAPAILLAKDIGITPMIAMAWELHRRGSDFTMHYLTRQKDNVAFSDDLANTPFATKVHVFLGDADSFLDGPGQTALAPSNPGILYVCGSSRFVRHSTERAIGLGRKATNIRSEGFTPPPVTEGQPLEIVAARSGRVITVTPPQSIASALVEAGISVDLSCGQGICGTCLTNVIDGTPDHRDLCQTRAEKEANRQIAICCSWSMTATLVLDF